MNFFSWLFKRKKPAKLKLGLALGSGGAKGFAELGVLRAFEENDIEFDVIAGTSIGSIIGAFYANGYTSKDILEMLRHINWGNLRTISMKDIRSFAVMHLVEKSLGEMNIEELKKPFRAVATNYHSGKEKVFKIGSVPKALSASSCMLPFFKPVEIDGETFVDGAYCNAVPADQARLMGADFVVGVDLSYSDGYSGVFSKLFAYPQKVENPNQKGYDNANIMLRPDLRGYSALSITGGVQMFDIGYKTAIELMPKIKSEINNATLALKKSKSN